MNLRTNFNKSTTTRPHLPTGFTFPRLVAHWLTQVTNRLQVVYHFKIRESEIMIQHFKCFIETKVLFNLLRQTHLANTTHLTNRHT